MAIHGEHNNASASTDNDKSTSKTSTATSNTTGASNDVQIWFHNNNKPRDAIILKAAKLAYKGIMVFAPELRWLRSTTTPSATSPSRASTLTLSRPTVKITLLRSSSGQCFARELENRR